MRGLIQGLGEWFMRGTYVSEWFGQGYCVNGLGERGFIVCMVHVPVKHPRISDATDKQDNSRKREMSRESISDSSKRPCYNFAYAVEYAKL